MQPISTLFIDLYRLQWPIIIIPLKIHSNLHETCFFNCWFNEACNDPRETTLVTLAHRALICRAFLIKIYFVKMCML